MYMENEMTVLKINKFKSAALVTVTYRLANGEVRVASGKTESEAMANIGKVVEVKSYDFAPLPKRSNSGSYFRNNNGLACYDLTAAANPPPPPPAAPVAK